MNITAIETFATRIPLKPEYRMISALGQHHVSQYVLVKVTTDSGLFGVGEATVMPRWSGETVWGAKALIDCVLAPVVLGCDIQDLEELDRRMDALAADNWFAKSAIEMAVWDIAGKAAHQPVYELLGGAVRSTTIRSRFSLGAYPPEIAAQRAVERVQAGFDTIKVKVGTDPLTDVSRVLAVRKAVGSQITLTVDANGGWDLEQALWCLKRLEDCHVEWVEQPLPRRNFNQLRQLRQQTGCRILADESCFDEVEARELIAGGCCDALSIYPGKNGGIRKARKIALLAEQHGLPCTIGSNLEWDIATAAMLHLVVATANLQVEQIPGDCLGPSYHAYSIVRQPLTIEGPRTSLSRQAGLGIDVDWDVVFQHPASTNPTTGE
ncbi:MAG: hypothetical protein KF752_04785 [Pirellulaceae bacterium]|nr:hypothetical protein [Pirellulaceae bacterium]